jgi:hypothetical protein
MVKKITVNCNFSGASQPVAFYIGDSAVERNPIGFQSRWLSETKGGLVPEKLMSSLVKIKKISDEHHIPFEDLYEHVIKEIESGKTLEEITVANKNQTQEFASNEDSQENNKASQEAANKEN